MWLFSAILLSISLSMDALGIGISYGLRKIQISILPKVIISFISLLFTALAIGIGNVVVLILPEFLAKLIGSLMLVVLGVSIIFQALKKKTPSNKKKPTQKTWSWSIKSLDLTIKLIHVPTIQDRLKATKVNVREALYLGVALSIDSFGAGISSAVAGMNSFLVPVLVGLCQFIFLSLGLLCGTHLSSFKKLNSNFFMFLSGIILIVLAAIRYFL